MAKIRHTCRFRMRLPGRFVCKEPFVRGAPETPPRLLDLGCPKDCESYQRASWCTKDLEDEEAASMGVEVEDVT